MLDNLRRQGFVPVEGDCLRKKHKHVSGPKEKRASDFLRFWRDPQVRAIMPPWGGELLVEILPLLDFAELARGDAKWVSGYSDVSTLLFPLTLLTGIATVHGSNLMDLAATQTDPLTNGLIPTLRTAAGGETRQSSVLLYQSKWRDFECHPDSPLNLTDPVAWKIRGGGASARMEGRLIGGCLDTIARLVGTPYAPLPEFTRRYRDEGVILYLENCELPPCEFARTLWNLRLAGWFDGLAGLVFGRSAGPDANRPEDLYYEEALEASLEGLALPVIYDADIGHRPPQFSIVNGALGTVETKDGAGTLHQRFV